MDEEQEYPLPQSVIEQCTNNLDSRVEEIFKMNKELLETIKKLRESFKPLIKKYEGSGRRIDDAIAVDGANSPIINFSGWSFSAVASIGYPMKEGLDIITEAKEFVVPYSTTLQRYVQLFRTMLEYKLTMNAPTDFVFLDGTFWIYQWSRRMFERKYEGFKDYPKFEDLYDTVFDELYPKIFTKKVICLPKRIESRKWAEEKIAKGVQTTDKVLLSYILDENEHTIPKELADYSKEEGRGLDPETLEEFQRKIVDIRFVYFKPKGANSVMRIEFHKSLAPKLEDILETVSYHFEPVTQQFFPILMADRLSKGINNMPMLISDIVKSKLFTMADDEDIRKLIRGAMIPIVLEETISR